MADFDWGNLLYLAAIIIISIIGGRKKKKTKSNPYQPVTKSKPDSSTGFFEQILGVDLKNINQETRVEYSKPVSEHIYNEQSVSHIVNKDDEKDVMHSKVSRLRSMRNEQEISDKPIFDERSEVLKSLDDFDLKKAVIYSEILARKEY